VSSATSSLFISSTGNVGIGTTTPFAKLAVENTGAGNSFIVGDASSDSTPFVINSSGNVGVGTILPQELLHVSGSVTPTIEVEATDGDPSQFKITNTEGSHGLFTNSNNLYVYDFGAPRINMFINSSGQVSVGTIQTFVGTEQFQVYGNGVDTELLVHEDAGTHSSLIHLRRGAGDWLIANDGALNFTHEGNLRGGFTSGGDFFVDTNVLYVDIANNKVGIGNTSPATMLDVTGTTTTTGLQVQSNCIRMQSPDASYSSCCVDNSDVWSCTGL